MILIYLEDNWSEKIKNNFLKISHNSISTILLHPESFPCSERNKTVRKCVVTKQTTFYYVFNDKEITIISVFDTRQDPNNIKKDIK
ncbi:type II toxin-antitoxin system RelE/ParE family toxin [Flavobacterium sp. P7388]|uniref:Type II toxin-antitoxin system RelE/ParE family toxin n=2 Tax=Flavobacterium geliluteum TaxID=2816120 RepID=A0A940X9Z2_9FLAO|nr:type II toxin-antitoxin system RelE/ParE family toxin [Flavobacterium geliluteum]